MGKPLAGDDAATYTTAHGMGYTRFESAYKGIAATQTVFIPVEDDVELWDVRVTNTTDRARKITVGSYVEFSYHTIEFDNQNFQMSLYRSEEQKSDLQSRG